MLTSLIVATLALFGFFVAIHWRDVRSGTPTLRVVLVHGKSVPTLSGHTHRALPHLEITALEPTTMRRIVLNGRTGDLDCDSAAAPKPKIPKAPRSMPTLSPKATEAIEGMMAYAGQEYFNLGALPFKLKIGDRLEHEWVPACGVPVCVNITTSHGQRRFSF